MKAKIIKVGNDNLFQSHIFSQTIANLLECEIQLINSTGAIGEATGRGFGIGIYKTLEEAFDENTIIKTFKPNSELERCTEVFQDWNAELDNLIINNSNDDNNRR